MMYKYGDVRDSERSISELPIILNSLILSQNIDEINTFFQEHESQLEQLLKYLDHEGQTFLHIAADFGTSAIVERLIQMGLEVNAVSKKGQTPLHQTRDVAIAKLLLKKGANVNAVCRQITLDYSFFSYEWKGTTALHLATRCNGQNLALIELLLEFGADINKQDGEGKTPKNYLGTKELAEEFDALVEKHQGTRRSNRL